MTGETNLTYWTTVAQIIPVLLLAMTLEWRELRRNWGRVDRLMRWFYVAGSAAGFVYLMIIMSAALSVVSGTSGAAPPPVENANTAIVMVMLYLTVLPFALFMRDEALSNDLQKLGRLLRRVAGRLKQKLGH